MLVKLIENEWNEEYDEILEKLKTILNPDSVIAFFSDYAFSFEHNSKTQEEIIEEMHKRLNKGRTNMPDYSFNYLYDFHIGLVQLDYSEICALVPEEECNFDEEGKAKPEIISVMIARTKCLCACENDRIIAIYRPE